VSKGTAPQILRGFEQCASDEYKLAQLLRSDRRFLWVRLPPCAPVEGEAELAASLNARAIRTRLTLLCVVGV
jgi:hypothetical protein